MRPIGLHLRIFDSILAMAYQAEDLKLSTFQCFLLHQQTRKRIRPTRDEQKKFKDLTQHYICKYVHGAYWINMCGRYPGNAYSMMSREIELAQDLGFTHYVLHPGAAIGWEDKKDAIYSFAQLLEKMVKQSSLTILLENTAHGGLTVGSNLEDFKLLSMYINDHQRIQFCIDTAHAFVYGYDIRTHEGIKQFIQIVDDCISWSHVALLHINDSKESLGSKKDKHSLSGQGFIPKEALKEFAFQKTTMEIPIIFEVPNTCIEDQMEMIAYFK